MSDASQLQDLPGRVQELVASSRSPQPYEEIVDAIQEAFAAITTTLHRRDPGGEVLHLVAARGLPDRVLQITRTIPVGKGMAGLCAQRAEPVRVCNLQTDESGQARPGAKETQVAGGIVVPVFDGGGDVVGTLGVGKPAEHDYTEAEVKALEDCARALGRALGDRARGGGGGGGESG